ncbi:MAG: hypothetical protein V7655_15010 [Aequorivita antarctica]
MNRIINFFKNNATFKTVFIIAILYIGSKFIFGEEMGIIEIITTLLIILYIVWGFNLQFWKSKIKIDREE